MAWSVLQSVSASNAASSCSAAMGSNLSSGSKLIAAVSIAGNGSAPSPVLSDGNGNNFTQIAVTHNTTGNVSYFYLFALDTPSGDVGTKPTISLSGGLGNGVGFLVQEVSGLATGYTVDGTAGTLNAYAASGGNVTTGNPTYSSSAANEYLVSAYMDDGDSGTVVNSSGAPSGYTRDSHSISGNGAGDVAIAYANSSDGSESGGWSVTAGSGGGDAYGWGLIVVAFLLAAPPPPAAEIPLMSAWPGFPAPGLFVPGKLIFYSTSQRYTETLAAVIASTGATPNRSIGKIIKASVTAVPNVTRAVFRTVIAGLAIVTAVARRVQRALTGNIAAITALTAGRLLHATLVAVLAATVSTRKTIGRTLAGIIIVTGALARSIVRNLPANIAALAALSRKTARNLTTTVTAVTALSASKLKQVALTAVIAMSSATQRNITKILNGQVAVSIILTRVFGKTITALSAVTARTTRMITRTLASIIVVTASSGTIKAKLVQLAALIGVTSAQNRQVTRTVTSAVAVTASVTRSISRTLTGKLTVSPLIARVISKPLTSTVAATATVGRCVLKMLAATVSVLPAVTRNISKTITAFLSTAVQITVFQPGKVIISTILYIILPGGGYKRITAPFNITLPAPKVNITGFLGTFGTVSIKLPELETSFAASVTHPLKIVLPKPEVTFTGTDWYARLSVTLPKPETSLTGQIGHVGEWQVQFGETPLKLVQKFLGDEEITQGEPPDWTIAPPRVNWKAGMPGTEWTVGYNSSNISQLSTEYVLVPVAAMKAGVPYNPTSDTVQFAFAPTAIYVPQSSDWKTGSWDTDTSSIIYPYNAKCLVGPNGVITLTLGTYIVYLKITDNPETPVLVAGQLTIT